MGTDDMQFIDWQPKLMITIEIRENLPTASRCKCLEEFRRVSTKSQQEMKLKIVLDFKRIAGHPVPRLTAATENVPAQDEYYICISHNYNISSFFSCTNMKYDSFGVSEPSIQKNSIATPTWQNISIQFQRNITRQNYVPL